MTVLELSQRLASLADAHKECMTLISRLSKLSTPTDTARTDLANLIHTSLRAAESELELLRAQAEDDDEAGALSSRIEGLTEDLRIARTHYRKAHLTSTRNTLSAQRKSLLATGSAPTAGAGARGLNQTDLLLHASTDATESLRRTHSLLQSELARSRFAAQTLRASTEALTELTNGYTAFDDALGRARILVGDLVRRRRSDGWYWAAAVKVLAGTLAWILLRRLAWVPVMVFVWSPVRVLFWGASGAVGALRGLGGSEGGIVGGTVPAAAEVVGIPSGMLGGETRVPVVEAEAASFREEIERVIDEAETGAVRYEEEPVEKVDMSPPETPGRNPMSRSMEYDPDEERRVREGHVDTRDEL